MKVAALLVAVTACWSPRPDAVVPRTAPPPPRAPKTYTVPHRAVTHVPATEFEEAMMRITEFTEAMCRCADQPCTSSVMADISRWSTEWQAQHPDFKPSEEDNKQITEVAQTLMECLQHAGQVSGTP
jgi:hypothetical protein